jgi:hypothetical protein
MVTQINNDQAISLHLTGILNIGLKPYFKVNNYTNIISAKQYKQEKEIIVSPNNKVFITLKPKF